MSVKLLKLMWEKPVTTLVAGHLLLLSIAAALLVPRGDVFVFASLALGSAILTTVLVHRKETRQRRTMAQISARLAEMSASEAREAPRTLDTALNQMGKLLDSGRARVDESEMKYRTLVEQAAVAIYLHNGSRFSEVNSKACELLGYTREEFLAIPYQEILAENLGGDPAATLGKLPTGRQPDRVSHHRRKDGTIVPVEVSTTVVDIADRRFALSIVRDISERMRSEEVRDRSREQLQLVADNIPSLIALVDSSQRYQFVNRAFARWFKRFDRDVVGRAVKDVLHEATYRNARPYIERTLEGSTSVFQHTIYDRAAAPRHFLATYVPHRQNGRVVGYVALEHDITELEAATIRVRESEARYRQLVESSPYCIHEISTEGILRSVNSSGVKMLGRQSEEELIGTDFAQCASPEDTGPLREQIRNAVKGQRDELEYQTRDGRSFASSMTPLRDTRHGIQGLMGIVREITEQKRVEARRLEAEAEGRRHLANLQALSARQESIREEERKRISREIHDELGQLLTALKMELGGLEKDVLSLPDENARGALEERVIEAGDLADRTIRSVREIAMRIRPSLLDELGLIPALQHECARYREHSGLACSFTTSGDIPDLEDAIATALFRLCQEFLTNIARHARATRADVRLARSGDTLTLTVTDDGVGISSDAETTSGHLGLIGARERVHNLNGTLQLDASPNRGTVATVNVPLPGKIPYS